MPHPSPRPASPEPVSERNRTARRTVAVVARSLSDADVTSLQILHATKGTLPIADLRGRLTCLGLVGPDGLLTTYGKAVAMFTLRDCAWCGGETRTPWINRRGALFCSRSHRQESNAALRRFAERTDKGPSLAQGES